MPTIGRESHKEKEEEKEVYVRVKHIDKEVTKSSKKIEQLEAEIADLKQLVNSLYKLVEKCCCDKNSGRGQR